MLKGCKGCFTGYDISANAFLEAAVTILNDVIQNLLVNQLGSSLQTPSKAVHTCDVRQEQIVRFERSTANLRIEVDAAAADTTGLQHFEHR
ncbi:hypothetical protein D3C80_2018150 [compost metagenome]